VEAETFACGTGVTASSISTYMYSPEKGHAEKKEVAEGVEYAKYDIHALGDDLSVCFNYNKNSKTFTDVYLTGPATFVFECDIEID
jgi:diaminopimelate epimerase